MTGPVLVTGAGGFVGAAVVRRLVADGVETVALVRDAARAGRLEPLRGRLRLVESDLADAASLRRAIRDVRPRACLHLAAAGAVAGRERLDCLLAVNTVATARLAGELAESGCERLVTAGSSSEYGPREGAMRESELARPDDVYGVSKLAGGLLAQVIAGQAGMRSLHLRIFSAYGPGEDRRRLVASVAGRLLAGRPIELTQGAQVRDFVYVDDIAGAFACALASEASGASLNVGSGRETSVRELCLLLCELAGADPGLLRFGALPYRAGERFSWKADTRQARQVLGWSAQTSLRDGLAHTLEALRLEVAA